MDLHHLTAAEAGRLFRKRELSPVELLDEMVRRTKEVEPLVNAVTEELLDDAYDAARESEARFAVGAPAEPRPLEGIPLMLKDEQPIAGRLAQDGSLLERGQIADVTHPIVDRIHAAGAVVHGRTTTPEFCCAPVTHTQLWGVTRNPWNPAMTPGGSSGGSGAALATGSTLLATGSDIGGSIRIPAAQCGVVGFKPPFGRVPGLTPFNSDTYCADGPMARSVEDVALLQNVIAGPWVGDQASLAPKLDLAVDPDQVRGFRVAVCPTLGDYEVDSSVLANTLVAADALRDAGLVVDEVSLPWRREETISIAWAHFRAIMGAFIDGIAGGDAERVDQLMPYTRAFASAASGGGDYAEGLIAETDFYRPLGELFETYDVLLCPTMAQTDIAADDPFDDPERTFANLMTLPFNVVGRVPVLATPSGVAPTGVPTGVQIVGRRYDDATAFNVGAALERALGLWTKPTWWPTLERQDP